MEARASKGRRPGVSSSYSLSSSSVIAAIVAFEVVLLFLWIDCIGANSVENWIDSQVPSSSESDILSHSCIHDQILDQRRRPGKKVYSVTPQVYREDDYSATYYHKGRALLGISAGDKLKDKKQPIRIFLNYDAVGSARDRDCQVVGGVVKLGEPPMNAVPGTPACNPHADPPVFGDCWYNCTSDDISGDDKKERLRKALEQTADWFKRALAVEPVKGNLRLSGYSACGQDGGVQLPHEYVEDGVADTDLVLLVTTRPTTGNTLAWAVACERDQWGRAIAGHVNVAPRHLTAEAETLLSATLIHEVMHVLGFDPHAFAHFRDERKRRRSQVTVQAMDEKLGRMVTRVVLPRVVMHSRHHYGAFSENFTGLELEDGGGRGTSGGQSSLADYCTYFVAYSDGSCTDINSARAPDRMLGEVRGSSSRCMSSSLVRTGFVRGSMTQGNGCYQHRCINNTLEVAVDGIWKVCPEAGGPVQFPSFNGELICPAYHELCNTAPVPLNGTCPGDCSGKGRCLSDGVCECENGHTGIDCSTAVCDEQCSLHGGVCDNGVCEFRCSDYAGYTCQNSSTLLPILSTCKEVLVGDAVGQHCAPSEPSILQQLEAAVVKPNQDRLMPAGRQLFSLFNRQYCAKAAKQLACWM
ncbi:hypothetical protein QJS10_CPA02g00100 [Acorus calamus]|uniref:EGF-like domain-containing protein n=1 Tax=Acorus calamus TaxID=4465 RepID=A0AAV9FB39_ACOCL|nr:hypothetical protein QJS10_CPA02g00100 [Acorus calamus]